MRSQRIVLSAASGATLAPLSIGNTVRAHHLRIQPHRPLSAFTNLAIYANIAGYAVKICISQVRLYYGCQATRHRNGGFGPTGAVGQMWPAGSCISQSGQLIETCKNKNQALLFSSCRTFMHGLAMKLLVWPIARKFPGCPNPSCLLLFPGSDAGSWW